MKKGQVAFGVAALVAAIIVLGVTDGIVSTATTPQTTTELLNFTGYWYTGLANDVYSTSTVYNDTACTANVIAAGGYTVDHAHNAVMSGGAFKNGGVYGMGLDTNTTGSRATAEGGTGSPTSDRTFMVWIYANNTATGNYQAIFGRSDLTAPAVIPWLLVLNQTGHACIAHTDTGVLDLTCGNSTINSTNWTHITGILDHTNNWVAIYVNGTLDVNETHMGTADSGTELDLTMGTDNDGLFDFWGIMDGARLFGTVLSTAQINAELNSGVQILDARFAYEFDYNDNNTAYDTHFFDHLDRTDEAVVMHDHDYDNSTQCISYDYLDSTYLSTPLLRTIMQNVVLIAAVSLLTLAGVYLYLR